MSDEYGQFASSPKKGMSGGVKFGIGCGIVVILLVCGGIGGVIYWFVSKMAAFEEEFTSQGYALVEGQVIAVEEPVMEDTLFTGQAVRIESDVQADIAIGAQTADIRSRIDGDVDFLGQSITIHEDAVITGDLRVRFAQAVIINGRVEGEVTGSWQVIDRSEPGATPDAEPDAAPDVAPDDAEPEE